MEDKSAFQRAQTEALRQVLGNDAIHHENPAETGDAPVGNAKPSPTPPVVQTHPPNISILEEKQNIANVKQRIRAREPQGKGLEHERSKAKKDQHRPELASEESNVFSETSLRATSGRLSNTGDGGGDDDDALEGGPGAFRVTTMDTTDNGASSSQLFIDNAPVFEAEATLVGPRDGATEAIPAKDVDGYKRRITFVGIGICVLLLLGIGAVIAVVVLTRPSSSRSETNGPTLSPTKNDLPPVSDEEYMLLVQEHSQWTTFQDGSATMNSINWIKTDMLSRQLFANDEKDRWIQRFAMATLYFSTGEVLSMWLSSENECLWADADILCDPTTGLITSLGLGKENLVGTIPLEIHLFRLLRDLNLGQNNLMGSIPTQIGELTLLTALDMDDNHEQGSNTGLTGPLPTEIGLLLQLESLNLDSNLLEGALPSELGALGLLDRLDLDTNNFNGKIPSELGECTNMKDLYLHKNKFTGSLPASLDQLTALESFRLYNNSVTGTLPDVICNTISDEFPSIDCGEIVCACCTDEDEMPCP